MKRTFDIVRMRPRALTPSDIERLKWNDAYHAERRQMKPGISGLAQLYGGQHRKNILLLGPILHRPPTRVDGSLRCDRILCHESLRQNPDTENPF
ncbi:MAG: hypothetical protein LBD89_03470 [Tannerellaceae bacterium]|nr:hypothetical protein [Tannerellaceae bacterium]